MRTIRPNEIVDDSRCACVYCGDEYKNAFRGCCGEMHFEKLLELDDGELLLESEIEIEPYTEEELAAAKGDEKLKFEQENKD